jgi:hypothetical protein
MKDPFEGSFRLPDLTSHFHSTVPHLPNIKPLALSLAEDQYASEFHKRLAEIVNNFQAELDPEHEVGVRLVNFGQTVIFHLEDIGFYNPSLIRFYGRTAEGTPVELIQHVSQISVLLMRLAALDPDKPIRIGFHVHDEGGEG